MKNIELIKKFKKQISKVLDTAGTQLSYEGCNDIPEDFWEGLTEEDKLLLAEEGYKEGIIDAENALPEDLNNVVIAYIFAQWFAKLE